MLAHMQSGIVVVEYLLSCGSTTGNYHHDTFSAQENYGTQDDLKGGASDEEAEGLDDGFDVCLGVEELNKCLPNSEDEENPPDEAAENYKVKASSLLHFF